MKNNFKTALNDPEILSKYKNKPYHMAILDSLAAYVDKGHDLLDLPWFSMTKAAKQRKDLKKAA